MFKTNTLQKKKLGTFLEPDDGNYPRILSQNHKNFI